MSKKQKATESKATESKATEMHAAEEGSYAGVDATADVTVSNAGENRVVKGYGARWHTNRHVSLNPIVNGWPTELEVDPRVQVVAVTQYKFKLDDNFIGAATLQEMGLLREVDPDGAEVRARAAKEQVKLQREQERAMAEVEKAQKRAEEAQKRAEEKIAKIKADAEKRIAEAKAKGAKFINPKTGEVSAA